MKMLKKLLCTVLTLALLLVISSYNVTYASTNSNQTPPIFYSDNAGDSGGSIWKIIPNITNKVESRSLLAKHTRGETVTEKTSCSSKVWATTAQQAINLAEVSGGFGYVAAKVSSSSSSSSSQGTEWIVSYSRQIQYIQWYDKYKVTTTYYYIGERVDSNGKVVEVNERFAVASSGERTIEEASDRLPK